MATITSNASGNWDTAGTWVGGVKPANGDAVTIAAGHSILMDADLSGFADGIQTLTITGHATTPAMLYFKDGSSGYVKMKTGYNVVGTSATLRGRILANSDGVWGNTGSLAYANKAVIDLQGTASLAATYLDLMVYCTQPTNLYARTYGTKYDFTASGTTIDTVNDTIDLGVTPPAANTAVMITGTTLPGGLAEDTIYYVRSVSGNTCKLSYISGADLFADITSTGSGTVSLFTGHTNTSTATMNVLTDVTADTPWVTTDGHDRVVLVDPGPVDSDQQRLQLTTINVGTIVLLANVDSAQYPGARVYLSSRNVSIRSNSTSTSHSIIDYGSSTFTGNVLQCEIINTAGTGTTFYSRGVSNGYGHTLSGVVSGCNSGIYSGSGHSISGAVYGCSNGIYSGSGHSISGAVSGCSSGIYFGSGLTISGTVSGCYSGINYGSGLTISGTVSGCVNGIYSGSGHSISGAISGCSNGIYSGSGHTISGAISGCNNGIAYGSGNIISGTVSGCTYGIIYCGFNLYGSITNNTTNIRYLGSESGPLIRGRAFKYGGTLNDTRAWSAGGKMAHETIVVPPGYSYSHKFVYENGSYWNVMEWELTGTCILCAKHDATSLASDARLHFQIIDPASDPLSSASNTPLAEWIAADSTDWQYSTLAYARTDDRPLLIRVCAMRASGVAYAMVTQNVLQSVYSF